ncbi:unnamed protein product [Paramecium sonneborni]|uniref:Ion transport domain-containing protein n=1 Tax=Paramecium sonneborni TaxID=65129 RepID=A0A8S1MWT8_9CILI|nr:unnamed protein product [Paramecium sonneborni]
MSKEEAVTATLKQRLSAIQDKEIYFEDRESFSEDGKYCEYVQKQNREILKKVQELLNDDQSNVNQQDDQSFVLMNDNQKQDILEDLEEEFGQMYQETKVKINTYLKLIPKNDLQLAQIYSDKYPFLVIRKQILIFIKLISSYAQKITTHPLFELLTLLMIIFNSAMLAMDDPTTNVQTSFQDLTDIIFLAYYTAEAVLKIIAQGLIFPKKAYLKDTWNILDFSVIITAYIPYFLESNSVNLNALRSFRVLRPLRTVSSIKALRTILLALFASIAQLRDAVVVLIFFYSIFAIAGVSLFSGYLKRRCIGEVTGITWISDEILFCSDDSNCPFQNDASNEKFICGKQIANPQNNLVNFDTFGYSFLQVFIITTLEGWTTIQTAVMLTFSQIVVLYFIIVVIVGAFFLVNLTLAIIKLNFKPEKIQEELAQIKEEIEEYDYKQLRQLKLYDPQRLKVDTDGYGITWDKHHEFDQNVFMNRRKNSRNGGSLMNMIKSGNMKKIRNKNKVSFQPIKSAVYYSNPIMLKNKQLKIEGIYGMGNQNKLNQQSLGMNSQNNNNIRSSMVRRSSQSSNNDDRTSSKKDDKNNTNSNNFENDSQSKQTKLIPRKSIQFGDQQMNSEFLNSPMIDLQNENIRPLNGGTMLVHHRGSMDSSKSGESRQDKTPNKNHLEIPKLGEIKQQSQNVKSNQKFSLVAGMKYQKPPRNSPKPDSQKSLDQNEFDSVNLSELNTISDDDLDQRLEEMDIFVLDKNDDSENEKKKKLNQKEIIRQKRAEVKRLRDLNKNAQQHLDDASLKLKSKLFNTKLYPIIVIDSDFNSVDDVLVSRMLLKLEKEKLEQDQKIKEMDIKITYCFKNAKQSLELKKSSSGKIKSMTKSGYLKSGMKSKKNNLSLRRVQPIMDELHPIEDLQFPTDKNFEIQDDQNIDNANENSESDDEQDDDNNEKNNNNLNGSNSQKIKLKKKKKEQEKNEKLDFEQMGEKFQESSDCIVDLNRIHSVEINKQFNQQEMALIPSWELDQQNGVFYQEYQEIRQRDIGESNGTITAQASIEDVLLIADYTFYDQKFAKQMNSVMKALNYSKRETFIYLEGFVGFLKVCQNHLLYFTQSWYFEAAMNAAVAINTIILALDGLLPASSADTLSQFNLGFTILFTIELGLKVIGMGPKTYISDTMNIFDAVIVALSLVELFFLGGGTSGKSSLSAFRSVRIFRAFRVLRVTKLMRSLQFMGFLIKVLGNAFKSFMYIMILLLLFIFIFTLLGMAFFGGELSKTPSRQNYDDIQSAFLVVFQVLTLENWNSILWDLLIQDVSAFITVPYLVFWIMIGNYVFLNLFLAILLENFEEEYKNDKAGLDTNIEIGQDSIMDNTTQAVNSTSTIKSTMKTKKATIAQQLENNGDVESKKNKVFQQIFQYFVEPGLCQYSVYLFSQDNLIRRICYRIVKDDKFETLIFFMIFLTSTKLVFDTYIPDSGELKEISLDIDIFFAVFFGVEMFMKIIAFGFVQQENSYLRESWNILDFFIVIASFIDVSVSTINLSFVKILRLLRTLRPLRFITHNRSMKILVSALLQSINGIFNVAIVVILVWMMFAILGINLQKNKMNYCDTGDDEVHYDYGPEECKANGGVWENRKVNFDNILNGMLTLFILSTLEGWPDIMYWFIDADEAGPIKGAQLQFSWYFIIFILIGSILLMNLFIGVILVNYHLAEEASRDKILTQPQVDWIELQKLIVHTNPNLAMFFSPENPFRAKVFIIIKHRYFDPTILFIIVCNIVTMGLSQDDAPLEYENILQSLNTAFTFIFITEAILKIIALGPVGYMRNQWNQFDFFVVCASILDLILQFTGNSFISFLSAGPQLARVFRVLRVTRLFRLIKSFEGLQKLIETAIYSLPAMLNVSALLFLVFFIFSILGVFLFGSIRTGWAIDDVNNFSDFHHSFQLLFRCSTGEDWYKVMFDTIQDGQGYYCIFFIIFIVIQQYIMLNLFILIILDQYEINYFNSDNPLNKFQEYENMFIESWSKFAKEDKGMKMNQQQLVPLLLDMEKPIGYDLKQKLNDEISEWRRINPQLDTKESVLKQTQILKAQAKRDVSTQIMKMNIYSDITGQVKYHQILFSVMKSYMWKKVQVNLSSEGADKILQKEDETYKRLKKKQVGVQSKEVTLVNPIVQFLFVHMAFKTLRRYGEKKKQQKELQAQLLLEQEQEHYSEGFSSDSSFDNKIEILSRNSKDTEHPKRPDYGRTKYLSLPNTEIYKEEICINQETPAINDSERSSKEEEEEPDEDVMQQYTKDFKKHLINPNGSTGNIQEDKNVNNIGSGAIRSSQSRTSQITKQPKRLTLKPSDLIQGLGASKKSIQSNQPVVNQNPNISQDNPSVINQSSGNSNSNK